MISVIIPAHNRPEMLYRAVESVLAQDFADFELIVVDDGSSDSLADVEALLSSAGHRFVRTENHGVAAARNRGVELSSGEWLAFLDSDDRWFPSKLSSQLRFHEENPELLVSQSEEIWIRNGKRVNRKAYHILAEGEAFNLSLKRCSISPSSVMIRRKLFLALGAFDERMTVCEDYDLWLRLTLNNRVGLIKEPLIEKYGGHDDQLSRSQDAIDRFRLFSLLKLIFEEEVKEWQLKALLEEIDLKNKILLQGAKKRSLPSVFFYEELKETLIACQQCPELNEEECRNLFMLIYDRLENLLNDHFHHGDHGDEK